MKKWDSILILLFFSFPLLAEDFPTDFILNCKGQVPALHRCYPEWKEEDSREITLSFSGNGGIFKENQFFAGCYPTQDYNFGKILDVVKDADTLSFVLRVDGYIDQINNFRWVEGEGPSNHIRAVYNRGTRNLLLEGLDPDHYSGRVLNLICE